MSFAGGRDIVIPHDLTRGPLRGIRRLIVQSSLSDLKELGYYPRYRQFIQSAELTQLSDAIGPGWLPIELALAHYRACDALGLSDEQITQMGRRAGARMHGALVVGVAKPMSPGGGQSPWEAIGAFSRMGRRIYDGGSTQYVRLGPRELQLENVANTLFSLHYFRIAHLAFLREAFAAFGVAIKATRPINYNRDAGTADVRISWS